MQQEPTVLAATVRTAEEAGITEYHLECRMSDGQKGPFVVVDGEFPQLAHNVAASINEQSLLKRDLQLIELIGRQFGRDVQVELQGLAEAYQSGRWNPWQPLDAPAKPVADAVAEQPALDAAVILRPGMHLGFGSGGLVGQLVKVKEVASDGFRFTVVNGGWGGVWRSSDKQLFNGEDWRPAEIVYIQGASEKLSGSYHRVMAYMEQKLAEGYALPQLVLPDDGRQVTAKPDAATLGDDDDSDQLPF